MSLGGDPDETVGKKPPLFAALSDPDERGVDSAAVGDDSGSVAEVEAAVATDPVSAGAAPSLGTGLIMLLVPNSPTSSTSSRGLPLSPLYTRDDYRTTKRLRRSEKGLVWLIYSVLSKNSFVHVPYSNHVRTGT